MTFGNGILAFENATVDLGVYLGMAKEYVLELQPYDHEIRWSEAAWLNDMRGTFLVREEDGKKLVGFVVLEIVSFYEKPNALYFSEFYLSPGYRRRGIGREAVSAILDQWAGDIFFYVLDWNSNAAKFWNAMALEFNWSRIERPEIRQERGCELRVYRQPSRE